MNRKVFCSLLRDKKMQIDAAESGQRCLEMVTSQKYDIIFLDHMMPEMDGIETLHRLKQLPDSKCQDVPIIALTANVVNGAKDFYLSEGFDAFLGKPFNPDDLEKLILEKIPKEYILCENEELPEAVQMEEELHKDGEDIDTIEVFSKEKEEELPYIEGIDLEYALSHFNDRESMFDIMEGFCHTLIYEADKLERFYAEVDDNLDADSEILTQYRIQIHSMKSSANLIGATGLGTKARELEEAARSGNVKFVVNNTVEFLNEWRNYKQRLEPFFKKEENRPEIDMNKLIPQLESLKIAFEEMDLDHMDAIMHSFKEYSFAEEIREDMEKLSDMVANLDVENGVELIETLLRK